MAVQLAGFGWWAAFWAGISSLLIRGREVGGGQPGATSVWLLSSAPRRVKGRRPLRSWMSGGRARVVGDQAREANEGRPDGAGLFDEAEWAGRWANGGPAVEQRWLNGVGHILACMCLSPMCDPHPRPRLHATTQRKAPCMHRHYMPSAAQAALVPGVGGVQGGGRALQPCAAGYGRRPLPRALVGPGW